jgi:hypothetical protein
LYRIGLTPTSGREPCYLHWRMADKRRFAIVLALAAAGAGLLAASLHHGPDNSPPVIRGHAPGLELRFYKNDGIPLKPGDTLAMGDGIGAVYRNLGNESLWAFIFAYDAKGNLYWLEPHHQIATRKDDLSVGLAPSANERSIGGEARLEALPPGSFTVYAVVTPGILVTTRIERLAPSEHNRASLQDRFGDGIVIELPLTIAP